jgi:hypothetical protein
MLELCDLVEMKNFMNDFILGSVEEEVDRPSVQQRPINASTPTASTQAMKIIPEEDENPDSPPAE